MPLSNPPSFAKPGTCTASTVAAATTSGTLLAANLARSGFSVWNASTAILYIDFGATVTTAAYGVRIDPSGYYESPVAYTGQVAAIWTAVNGSAQVREFS